MLEQKKDFYIDYIVEQTKNILSIDSPSGYTKDVIAYLAHEYETLGYEPIVTRKGGLLVKLCDGNDALLWSAHADTLGAMVHTVKGNGNLQVLSESKPATLRKAGAVLYHVQNETECVLFVSH